MKVFRFIVKLLLVIGALNWGMVGFFNDDVVSMIFGYGSMAAKVVFCIVGLAGVAGLCFLCKSCCCGSGSCGGGSYGGGSCGPRCNCGCCKK